MKKIISLALLLALSVTGVFAQKQYTEKEFQDLCAKSGLVFEMPENYTITDIKKNRDLGYSFAIINSDSTMEIRYTIWSLQPDIKRYEESLKDTNTIMVPPNNIYKGRVQANVLNMTGGQMNNIGEFPSDAVKREFNADAGGSCFFEFNCEFGKGYKYGQFIYLHKDNVADAMVTFMSNDINKHTELMSEGFHSLKFK